MAGLAGGLVSAGLQLCRMTRWRGSAAYLTFTVLIGIAFGWILRRHDVGGGPGAVWGVLYGAGWWIVSGLGVIPALYGVAPLTPAAVEVIHNASLPWFAAMLLNGGVLGGVYGTLSRRRRPRAGAVTTRASRAA